MKTCVVLVIAFLLVSNAFEINASQYAYENAWVQVSRSPDRTSYHFQPPKNWLNGPMYYKGVYHLFYQHNPYGAVFNLTIVWAHAVSYDLINWIHLQNTLTPTKPFDINSCFSGSVTILPGGKPVILYTGVDAKNQQVQNLAIPKNLSDPFLQEWVKYSHNPIMTPPNGVKPGEFRDPSTAWKGKDGNWRVVVGGLKNNQGMVILYRSKDFFHWTKYERSLYSNESTGTWECPDFYPVFLNSRNGVETSDSGPNMKYVLKASFNSRDYYTIGSYVPDKEIFDPAQNSGKIFDLRYDYGKFYASKTFFDSAKNRRILWGWVSESDSSVDDIKKGWAGILSFPRRVFLSKNGMQLVQWPVEEIESLHSKHVSYHGKVLKRNSLFEISGITASQADVEASFKLPKLEEADTMDLKGMDPQLLCSRKSAASSSRIGPFGLLVMASEDLKEHTAIFFLIFKDHNKFVALMCSDQSRSSLKDGLEKTTYGAFLDIDPRQEMISLRSLIDHSVIESYGVEGRACITARVYPTLAINEESHLFVFNNGSLDVTISRLDGWSMTQARFSNG